jgi:hypothetical protein
VAGIVAIDHPVSLVNIAHVMVIIDHNWQLYRILVFIAKTALIGWIVNICLDARVSCPSVPQLSSHLWSLNITLFVSQCFVF